MGIARYRYCVIPINGNKEQLKQLLSLLQQNLIQFPF